jgi:hypothetical protein
MNYAIPACRKGMRIRLLSAFRQRERRRRYGASKRRTVARSLKDFKPCTADPDAQRQKIQTLRVNGHTLTKVIFR